MSDTAPLGGTSPSGDYGRQRPQGPGAMFALYFAFILAAGVGVASFFSSARDGEIRRRCSATCLLKPDYAAANRTAPDFELPDMKGQKVRLSSFRGKTVVLNFWTKTCGPCMEEMPEIADLARIVKDRSDVVVLTVSVDDGPDSVRDTLKAILRADPPFQILFDPDSKVVTEKYGTTLFPETWIIDARGVIRARFDGGKEWAGATVVEYIDQVRSGSYCPLDIVDRKPRGEAARLCQELTPGPT